MAIKKKVQCPRCDGKGVIPQYFYNRKGICFLCWGSKYIYIKVPEGMTEEAYREKLRKDEIEHLKNHPPKVPMPDADKHRNKAYFRGANTKIDVQPVEKGGDGEKDGKTPKTTRTDLSNDRNTLIVERVEGDMVIQRGEEYTARVSKGVFRTGKVVGISHAKKSVTLEFTNETTGQKYKLDYDAASIYPKGYDGESNKKNFNGDTVRKGEDAITYDETSKEFKELLNRDITALERIKKTVEENLKNTEARIAKWQRDKKDGTANSETDNIISGLENEKKRLSKRLANINEAIRRVEKGEGSAKSQLTDDEKAQLRKNLESKAVGELKSARTQAEEFIKRGRPKHRPADYSEESNKKALARAEETIKAANEIIKQIEAERPQVDRNTIVREPLELSKLGQEYTVLKRGDRVKIYHSGSTRENAVYHEGIITAISNATGKIKVKRDGIDEDSAWHDSWIDVRNVTDKLEANDKKPFNVEGTREALKKLELEAETLLSSDNATSEQYEDIINRIEAVEVPDRDADDSEDVISVRRQKRSLKREMVRAKEAILVDERMTAIRTAKNLTELAKGVKEFDTSGFDFYTPEDLQAAINRNVNYKVRSFIRDDIEKSGLTDALNGFSSDATVAQLAKFKEELQKKYGNIPEAKPELSQINRTIEFAMRRIALDEERKRLEEERRKREEERKKKEEEAKKAIEKPIEYKDTELGRKIKEIANSSDVSVERTAKIGKVVGEALESRTAELYGEGYAEADRKFKEMADLKRELHKCELQLEEAMKKMYDKRLKPEKREEWKVKRAGLEARKKELDAKMKTAGREMAEYHRKLNTVKEKAYLSVMNEIREMGGELTLNTSTSSKKESFIADRYKNDIAKLYPKEWLQAVTSKGFKVKHTGGRAYVQGYSINVNGTEDSYESNRSTFLHELQHAMDDSNQNLKKLTKDLYIELTNKGKVKKIYGGTSEEYRTKNDGSPWLHNYMGKLYSVYGKTPEGTVAWEMNTMAMEMIVTGRHEWEGVRLQDLEKEIYYHMLGVLASV